MPMHTSLLRQRRSLIAATAVAVITATAGLAMPAYAADDDLTQTGGAAHHHDQDQTDVIRQAIENSGAKNVILLIGDGMGDSEITVARDYAVGAAGRLAGIDALPLTGQYTTYSLDRSNGKPDYVTDSAASGTGWATGTKTYDGAIGVDVNGEAHSSLLEIAKANGLKTGDVSTAEVQDATPAVQISHVSQRKCYGPEATSAKCPENALENGGAGSISEQLLDVRPDVTLAGGSKTFNEKAKAGPWKDKTLIEQAEERGYTLVDDAASLDTVTAADQSQPVLGLFAEGNFPVRYNTIEATAGGGNGEAQRCTESSDYMSDLSLDKLTSKAINLLNRPDSDRGFFLQVEGASIDKQDHAANACGQIGETVDLDNAVKTALDFAKQDGDTLVIATADHAHTSQIVDAAPPATLSVPLLTADGQKMIVAYGTAEEGGSQQHTGTQVRIAAYGPGAANVVSLSDQTDVFDTVNNTLSTDRDVSAQSASASAHTQVDGDSVVTTGEGFKGDWTVNARLDETDLGQADVIDGSVSFTGAAPTEPGTYTVTLTGNQSGTVKTATFTVGADGAVAAPTGSNDSTSQSSSLLPGGLASTGLAGIGLLIAALAAIALGVALLVMRRRRQIAAQSGDTL